MQKQLEQMSLAQLRAKMNDLEMAYDNLEQKISQSDPERKQDADKLKELYKEMAKVAHLIKSKK